LIFFTWHFYYFLRGDSVAVIFRHLVYPLSLEAVLLGLPTA
jgi:hypothetical protein